MGTDNVVVGAQYYDTAYDQEVEVVDVRETGGEITVQLEYENMGRVTITLDMFQDTDDFDLIDIPE